MNNRRIVLPLFIDLAASETDKKITIPLRFEGVLETLKFWATDSNVALFQKPQTKGIRLLGEIRTVSSDLTTKPIQKLYSCGELMVLPFNKPFSGTQLILYIENLTAAAKEAIITLKIMEKRPKIEAS